MSGDRSLMHRIQAGDVAALQEVMQEYWHPLVAYATRLLSDADEAEDVVQEVLLRLWAGRNEWTPTARLRGFLYQITRNLSLNELARAEVRQRWARHSGDKARSAVPTPLQVVERTELQECLETVLEELAPRRREVFVLSRYHGFTYREIAEIMDVSPQTVANQMSSALGQIREGLAAHMDRLSPGEGRGR